MAETPAEWAALMGQDVVVDTVSRYVYIGKLGTCDPHWLQLLDADAHDLRDTQTARELYVLEARRYGVRRNRARVWVRMPEVVSVSGLADVVDD